MKNIIDEKIIVKLYVEDGMTTQQIAPLYDTSYATINRRLRKNGVVLRPGGRRPLPYKLCGYCKKQLPRENFTRKADYICKDCANQYAREHPGLKSRYKKYGITYEKYQIMVEEQRGKCAICGRVSERRLAVDHDHKSGNVRKLLCRSCNVGIGLFSDNPDLLIRAAEYLKEHEQK